MPRGHHVCHEIQLTQRAACHLFRSLGVSCLFPCQLSVEVWFWLWGDCCLTVEVAVCVITIIKLAWFRSLAQRLSWISALAPCGASMCLSKGKGLVGSWRHPVCTREVEQQNKAPQCCWHGDDDRHLQHLKYFIFYKVACFILIKSYQRNFDHV